MNIIDFVEKYMYGGLFLLIFVEEIGVPLPIPGEAVLITLGILSNEREVNFLYILLLTVVATMLGASILYFVARKIGRPLMIKYERYLRYVHITHKDIDGFEHYMSHYGAWVLMISRVLPGLRIVGTIAAGILGVSYRTFFTATLVGTLAWTVACYVIGVFLGRQFADEIDALFSNKLLLASVFVVALLIWAGIFKFLYPAIKNHRHGSAKQLE